MRHLIEDHTFEGDFTKCVGQPCLVTIVNNKNGDRVYDNVAAVAQMQAKDAANCPDIVNDS